MGLNVIGIDVSSLFNQLLTNPLFTNTTAACQGKPACTNPNQYLFWDDLHPTTEADSFVADVAYNSVAPEPATYALFLLGGCGLLALRRARHNRY
jgi:phospholipase/lecithinase/hemolysin